MLSEAQRTRVWEGILDAETRSYYFADLARRYTRNKQIITGLSFFLSSGAAATVIGRSPSWVPAALALAAAAINAYSMAVKLDAKAGTMVKLHSAWYEIGAKCEKLWDHMYDEDAESQLYSVLEQMKAPSELAATEAPNDQELLGKWQERVFSLRRLTDQHG